MFKIHPTFTQPQDENVKIWRYLDFTKLISLIDSRRLFFTRADLFEDPFEGSWTKTNVESRKSIPINMPQEGQEKYLEQFSDINKTWRKYMAINCWHINEYESAAMWKLYLKSDEGIVIQSTYSRFKKSFIDDEEVYIGKIKYIDYEKDIINEGNLFEPFLHKRKSFEHEMELRAIICRLPDGEDSIDFSVSTIESGVELKVDIETLIEKIHVAPNAQKWFSKLVESVIKRYGYNFDVIQSQLNEDPLF